MPLKDETEYKWSEMKKYDFEMMSFAKWLEVEERDKESRRKGPKPNDYVENLFSTKQM